MGREAESAIPSLLGALNDGDPRVRARAAMAIFFIVTTPDHPRADDVRGALTAALADPDPAPATWRPWSWGCSSRTRRPSFPP